MVNMKMRFVDEQEQSRFLRQLSSLCQDLLSYAHAAAPYAAINQYAGDSEVLNALNRNSPFWNFTLAAHQNATFTALGRIHDGGKRAYLKSLLEVLSENASAEAKAA